MNLIIHFLAGILLAAVFGLTLKKLRGKKEFKGMVFWFSLANLIDLDHLLANPIYNPLRCGINFHPLHSWFIYPVYIGGLFHKKTKFLIIGYCCT